MDKETHGIIMAMKSYLHHGRHLRANYPAQFSDVVFSAVYTALNRLGYLDRDPPDPTSGAGS